MDKKLDAIKRELDMARSNPAAADPAAMQRAHTEDMEAQVKRHVLKALEQRATAAAENLGANLSQRDATIGKCVARAADLAVVSGGPNEPSGPQSTTARRH